jgi:hypothetical protein
VLKFFRNTKTIAGTRAGNLRGEAIVLTVSPSGARNWQLNSDEVKWQTLPGVDHFRYWMIDVDEKSGTIDFIARLEAFKPIVTHGHLTLTNTLVLEGEHRFYEPDGTTLKEVRPTGCYTTSLPGPAHRECGGEGGALILYNLRGDGGVYFTLLDDAGNVAGTLTMKDFAGLLEAQKQLA